jgi:CBS domain-containing membrane protein
VLHEALRKRLVTVEPATRATFAASLMLEHRIGCLPVVADGRLVGIFTTGDLLDLAANTLWKPERMLPRQRKQEILREAQ